VSRRRLATSVYITALRAFPRRHRATFAAEMIDTFERELESQRTHHGRLRASVFVVAAWLNVIGAGVGERRRQRRAGFTPAGGFSWIDVTLARRMFVRYPGLSIVGVFGMAVGIAIATAAFTIIYAILSPVVPLEDGERVVSIVTVDAATTNSESQVMHDFATWRTLRSLEDIGASTTVGRTLIAEGGQPETVSVAEISASGFRVARVRPQLGRWLMKDDERAGAPDVAVIGYNAWQRRFAGDPGIVGREIQLGSTTYAVVGVMPEGFGFPVNHSYWIPWRRDPSSYAPRTGPAVSVFARLAPGTTLESAQA
jgi:putative ABC transport system permease protein